MQKYEEICIEINRKERFSKNVMMYNTSPKPQKSLYQSFQRPHKPSCLPRRQRSHTYHPSIPCCAMLCRTVPCLGHRLQEKLLVISHETFVAFLELGRGSHHALRPWSDTMVSCCLYPCGFYQFYSEMFICFRLLMFFHVCFSDKERSSRQVLRGFLQSRQLLKRSFGMQ